MMPGYVTSCGRRDQRSGDNESVDLGKTVYGIPLLGRGLSGSALCVPS